MPTLDPIKDLKVNEFELKTIINKIKTIENKMLGHPLHLSDNLEENINLVEQKTKVSFC